MLVRIPSKHNLESISMIKYVTHTKLKEKTFDLGCRGEEYDDAIKKPEKVSRKVKESQGISMSERNTKGK